MEKASLPALSQSEGQPAAWAMPMKLLIVEDNAPVRRMIKTVVGSLAHEVYECENGKNALKTYRTHKPDVVLMDVDLGEDDGITATRYIMREDPTAYVVIVTNYDGADLREAARQAGAQGYVLKENLQELRQLLQARRPPF